MTKDVGDLVDYQPKMHPRRRRALLAPIVLALALPAVAVACGDDDAGTRTGAGAGADAPDVTAPDTFDESIIVGLPYAEAEAAAEAAGWQLRQAVIDGEDQALTMDFIPNRVNVAVEDGVVTAVVSVG